MLTLANLGRVQTILLGWFPHEQSKENPSFGWDWDTLKLLLQLRKIEDGNTDDNGDGC